jgi:hypothetical protein
MAWSDWTTLDVVQRRAGGRRGYNAHRTMQRIVRRYHVSKMLFERFGAMGLIDYGVCAVIARELGVARSTVCRDRKAIHAAILRHMYGEDYFQV